MISFPEHAYQELALCEHCNVERVVHLARRTSPYRAVLQELLKLCPKTAIFAIRRPEIITSEALERFYLPEGWTRIHIHVTDSASTRLLRGKVNLIVCLPSQSSRLHDWVGLLSSGLPPMTLRFAGASRLRNGLNPSIRRLTALDRLAAAARSPAGSPTRPMADFSTPPVLYPLYLNPYSAPDSIGRVRAYGTDGWQLERATKLLRLTDLAMRCGKRSAAAFDLMRAASAAEPLWVVAPDDLAPRSEGLSMPAFVAASNRCAAPLPRAHLPGLHWAALGADADQLAPGAIYRVQDGGARGWSARLSDWLPGCDRLCHRCLRESP